MFTVSIGGISFVHVLRYRLQGKSKQVGTNKTLYYIAGKVLLLILLYHLVNIWTSGHFWLIKANDADPISQIVANIVSIVTYILSGYEIIAGIFNMSTFDPIVIGLMILGLVLVVGAPPLVIIGIYLIALIIFIRNFIIRRS